METNIYFVRHAQSDNTVREDFTRPLTKRGMMDTKKVTSALIDKDISSIYSSPFIRTLDTVRDFANVIGKEIITIDDFRERNVGLWVEDFKAYSKRQWEDFDFRLENGESLGEVQKRNISVLLSVLKENLGKNIVIATHGTALSTIINYFNPNYGYDDFWSIIDKMPYILCFSFTSMDFAHMEEIQIK